MEIYLHIPFCVRKCAYCDFLSAPASEEEREEYVQLLCREIEACGCALKTGGREIEACGRALEADSRETAASGRECSEEEAYPVTSVFFGGGTPSLLTGEQVSRILSALRRWFTICVDAEITLEANPGTVTEEKLGWYREAGVNRLSIGLQSVHDEELRLLGRIHTYRDFLQTYYLARKAGFQNINIDLISAIPGQTLEGWEETLRTVAALGPEHISAYSLIIEPGTPFGHIYGAEGDEGSVARDSREGASRADGRNETFPPLPDEEEERRMYWRTKELLEEAGYVRYEISNYARPGFECRHNLGYWDRTPYLGFGVGAATLFCHARYTNPADLRAYQESFTKKLHGDILNINEEMEEFLFLGLRKMEGIRPEEFFRQFHIPLDQRYGGNIRKLKDLALLEEEKGFLRLTDRGIDVSNAVFAELLTL